ncbi:MAG: hypothetical protein IPK16_13160 [Anaerolineales bacterium]|nr:hypothetical protein [Anaerolineales bacterium]
MNRRYLGINGNTWRRAAHRGASSVGLFVLVCALLISGVLPVSADPDAPSRIYAPQVLSFKCNLMRTKTLMGLQVYGVTGSKNPYYKDMMDSGASWVRVDLSWAETEPTNTTPKDYEWSHADKVVTLAVEQCIPIVLTVGTNPSWAADQVAGPLKVSNAEMAQFVGALVERYDGDGIDDAPGAPRVFDFEFYNEPDQGPVGTYERWGLYGAQYAAMLKAVYPAVKAANPKAQVIFGGLAYDFFTDQSEDPANNGPFVRKFLDDVLKAGAGPYFDVMNFHFYPLFGGYWTDDFPKDGPGLVEKTEAIRAVMAKYGVTKPVIITEMGWHNNESAGVPHGSDKLQVRYVVQLYVQAFATDIKAAAWWPLGDAGDPYIYNSGLVTNYELGAPQRKKAYAAYQVFVQRMGSVEFVKEVKNSDDIKAYRFYDKANQRTMYVAWTNPRDNTNVWGTPTKPYVDTTRTTVVELPGRKVTVYDAYWNKVATVSDGDDGKVNGNVRPTINGDPRYIVVEEP